MNANDSNRYKEFFTHLCGDDENVNSTMFYRRLLACIGG
jgi:hypothetical protein